MKHTLILMSLFLSFSAFADLEHRDGQEAIPTEKNLTLSRSCFQEILEQGCRHPSEDRELFNNCLTDKITTLSSRCQTFFERLYGKRK